MKNDRAEHRTGRIGVPAAMFAVAIVLWAPVYVSFGIAIAGAISWCVWLEQHPSP